MTQSGIETVGVLGFGTMGAGIAQLVAQSGRVVKVLETDQARIDAGFRVLDTFLSGGVSRGKITEDDKAEIIGRVTGVLDAADLADVDLVIEAVTERMDVKSDVLGRVAAAVGEGAIIATNTSALSVTALANAVSNPARFAGLHFFNPAPVMKAIEVVQALQTEGGVVERLVLFVEEIGKSPVVVKDRPGFLVNRLLIPYLNDVIQAYDEQLASAEDIDIAIRLGLGHKRGPLELLDMIGLDVHRHASESAYEATLDPSFAPPPLLNQMVAAGYYGDKNGKGFRTGAEG